MSMSAVTGLEDTEDTRDRKDTVTPPREQHPQKCCNPVVHHCSMPQLVILIKFPRGHIPEVRAPLQCLLSLCIPETVHKYGVSLASIFKRYVLPSRLSSEATEMMSRDGKRSKGYKFDKS